MEPTRAEELAPEFPDVGTFIVRPRATGLIRAAGTPHPYDIPAARTYGEPVKTPQHDSRDRIRIAEVTGALSYLTGRMKHHGMTVEQGADELRKITTDPHLLSHGLANRNRDDETLVALAVAAGASVEEADRIHAEMHPPGARGLRLGTEGQG